MSDLKMLTQDEVATLLNVSRDQVSMLRETGKCYMFSQQEIKLFQENYKGYDVSNKVKALESYKIVNSIN